MHLLAEKYKQAGDQTLHTQQIVAIGGNINTIYHLLGSALGSSNVTLLFGQQLLLGSLKRTQILLKLLQN